jgi:2-C-methyl-D-erythritol 4-phosphate cytidylyltransferase
MAAAAQMSVAAIVVAAGSGTRLGAQVPKAFVEIGGRTLLEHACARLASPLVRDTIVVAPADWMTRAAALCTATIVAGGVTRQQSVAAGLQALADDVDVVLVHDVARPFVPPELVQRVLAALDSGADAAIPGCAVTDTIKQVDAAGGVIATLDRAGLIAVQTPQGFRRAVLVAAHAAALDARATDDGALVEAAGGRVVVVEGAREAFKITDGWDLALAESVVARD